MSHLGQSSHAIIMVSIASAVFLASCSIGQDVRTKRFNSNQDLNSPPNSAVAAVRQPTVPMKENAKWWEPVQQKCGPYATNLAGCYLSFSFKVKNPQNYSVGQSGAWTPIEVNVEYRKGNPNWMYVPKELNGQEAADMIAGKEHPRDVVALAQRVANYAICQGGDVRLASLENASVPLTSKPLARDPEHAAFMSRHRMHRNTNGSWSLQLECSLWRDASTVVEPSIQAAGPKQGQGVNQEVRQQIEALLNAY